MQVSSDCMYTRNNTLGIPTSEFIPGSYDYVSSDTVPRMINHAGILTSKYILDTQVSNDCIYTKN